MGGLNISVQDVLGWFDWRDSFRDLYPGYSDPSDINTYAEDFYYESEDQAVEEVGAILGLFKELYQNEQIIVYRAIRADSEESIYKEYLGESWSWDKQSAEEFGSHNGSNFLLIGQVSSSDVDWERSVRNFLEFSIDPTNAENENELVVDGEVKLLKIEQI